MSKYKVVFADDGNHFICRECSWTMMKRKDFSTSGLRFHLKSKHPKTFENFEKEDALKKKAKSEAAKRLEAQEGSLKRAFTSASKGPPEKKRVEDKKDEQTTITRALSLWSPDGEMTQKTERALMKYICTATLPLSTVESPGLAHLLSVLAPRFKLKSRTYFTRSVLNSVYEEYFDKVKSQLDAADVISFACDSWSSAGNNHSLLALTAHFVDKEMNPRFVVVGAMPIKARHTAENMKLLLAKALKSFSIPEGKIHVFVRDGDATMRRTMTLLNIISVDCFAHKVQLAVKDGLSKLGTVENGADSLVSRLTKIVRKLKKSRLDKEDFTACQHLCELPDNTLIKGIEVRWSSTYDMVSRFLENQKAVELFLIDHPHYPELDEFDWSLMRRIADLLKPLAVATKIVQHRFYAPISIVIPLYKVILKRLQEDSSRLGHIKEVIANGLINRMAECEEREEYYIATYVDPRFKDAYCANKRDAFLLKVEQTAYEVYGGGEGVGGGGGGGSPDSDVIEDDSNPFFEFWKEGSCTSEGDTPIQSPSPLTIDSKAKALAEVQEYLAHKPLFSGDPFEWWRNEINATKYPLIKKLAVRYLSAPATSAECERMFSTAGVIVNDLRKKLTAENLEKLLFLHHNVLILGF
ncbi:dimerization domain protein, hAT family [Ancylostoma duodenale]|uniref:Dimerization domain protein, hAT family n=1 Tax=Ancylostoma duodenale TaxID=51022 RepID=A0A0C2G3H3_9BILA|nr:dimerization domain protein, hAT family [Ancylostoma duodenale]